MPWTVNDVDKHKKGLTPQQKKQWVSTANSALKACQSGKVKPEGGGSCDAYAIKVANAAVDKKGKSRAADKRAEGQETPDASRRVVSMPIRAVDGADNRYRAYAVLFNTPDDRDLYGTYFNEDTDYRMEYFDTWPWLYHHTKNPDFGHRKVGVWDTRGIDDVGVFVEGEITAHGAYREAVEQLVDEEVLYTSSQAIHSGVRIEDDGHVEVWPICEVSSTVSPGDWRLKHPISQVAMRAIEVLETDGDGGEPMSWKEKLMRFIDGLPDGGDVEDVVDDADDEDTGERATEPLDVRAVAEQVVAMLDIEPVVRAVSALDEAIRTVDERLANMETIVGGLAESEPERLKDMLSGSDWFSQLYVASRSNDVVPEDEADDIRGNDGDVATLQEGETIFGRIAGGPPNAGG